MRRSAIAFSALLASGSPVNYLPPLRAYPLRTPEYPQCFDLHRVPVEFPKRLQYFARNVASIEHL